MRRQIRSRTMLTRTSHARLEERPSPCPYLPRAQHCSARPLLRHCLGSAPRRTRQASDGNAAMQKVWPAHSSAYPCSPRRGPEQGPPLPGGNCVLIGSNPSAIVPVERQFSCIFPAHPRPLARCLSRALRQLRGSASAAQPFGFRLSENLFGKTPHKARPKRFSEPSEKAPLGLGSGAHSPPQNAKCAFSGTPVLASLRARVSRG